MLRLAISVGIFVYLFAILDWRQAVATLRHARHGFVYFPPVILLLGLFIAALRFQLLAGGLGLRLALLESYLYYLIGNFYNVVLPGVIGGDAVRVGVCVDRKGAPLAVVAVTILTERFLGALGLLITGPLAMMLLERDLRQQLVSTITGSLGSGSWLAAGGVLGVLCLAAFLRIRARASSRSRSHLSRVIANLSQLPRFTILAGLFLSVGFQIPDAFSSFLLAKALRIDLPLLVFFAIHPVVYFATSVPVSLGGLGVREGVLVLLLSSLGVSASEAILLALLIYANRVVVSSVGGFVQVVEGLIHRVSGQSPKP